MLFFHRLDEELKKEEGKSERISRRLNIKAQANQRDLKKAIDWKKSKVIQGLRENAVYQNRLIEILRGNAGKTLQGTVFVLNYPIWSILLRMPPGVSLGLPGPPY